MFCIKKKKKKRGSSQNQTIRSFQLMLVVVSCDPHHQE